MPIRHRHRCLIADRITVYGLEMINHCERCLVRGVSCKVDLSSSCCSECICAAHSCSLVQSEVECRWFNWSLLFLWFLTSLRPSRGRGTKLSPSRGAEGRG